MRGQDLIMWPGGQWEDRIWSCDLRANERPKKNRMGRGQTHKQHTNKQTGFATTRPTRPRVPSWWKDVYGKYLSFASLGSYVAWLRVNIFRFPWRVIFVGFSAEDEQRPKLVSAHPQIPLLFEKSVMMLNSAFCKKKMPFVIVIFQTVSGGLTVIHVSKKIFDPISLHHTFHFFTNQEDQLWLLLVLWYVLLPQPFEYTKMFVRMSPILGCKSN